MERSCLDASHDSWDIPHLLVDMCTDPNDPIVRTTDLTQFFNSDDRTGHYQVEYDVKLYFPSFVKPGATKLSDVNTSSSVSVADYLNNSSCIDNGYCLRTNGWQSYSSSHAILKIGLVLQTLHPIKVHAQHFVSVHTGLLCPFREKEEVYL